MLLVQLVLIVTRTQSLLLFRDTLYFYTTSSILLLNNTVITRKNCRKAPFRWSHLHFSRVQSQKFILGWTQEIGCVSSVSVVLARCATHWTAQPWSSFLFAIKFAIKLLMDELFCRSKSAKASPVEEALADENNCLITKTVNDRRI